MSLSEKDIFQEALKDFRQKLHTIVPLRHFNEFYDKKKEIEDAAELEKSIVAEAFMWKVIDLSPSRIDELVEELDDEMQKATDEWITKNEDHISRTESFLENIMYVLCEDYRTSLEAQLATDPDVELESIQKSVEDGKLPPMIYFKQRWRSGNADFYKRQKQNLEIKLDQVGQEFLQKKYFEKIYAEENRDQEIEIVTEGNSASIPNKGKRKHKDNEEIGESDDSASPKRQRILRTPSPKVVYVQKPVKSTVQNRATISRAASAKPAGTRAKISLKLPTLSKVARATSEFQKSQKKEPAKSDAAQSHHHDDHPEESSDPPSRDPAKAPQQKKKGAKQLFAATP